MGWPDLAIPFSGIRDQHRSSNWPHADRVVANGEAGAENWVARGGLRDDFYNLFKVLQHVTIAVYIIIHT